MQSTLQCHLIHTACIHRNIAAKHIFWYLILQPTVFHLHWLGWTSARSPMTENTPLIWVCYQGLPYILLRHVCLSLSLCSEGKQTRATCTHLKTLGRERAHPFIRLALKSRSQVKWGEPHVLLVSHHLWPWRLVSHDGDFHAECAAYVQASLSNNRMKCQGKPRDPFTWDDPSPHECESPHGCCGFSLPL